MEAEATAIRLGFATNSEVFAHPLNQQDPDAKNPLSSQQRLLSDNTFELGQQQKISTFDVMGIDVGLRSNQEVNTSVGIPIHKDGINTKQEDNTSAKKGAKIFDTMSSIATLKANPSATKSDITMLPINAWNGLQV